MSRLLTLVSVFFDQAVVYSVVQEVGKYLCLKAFYFYASCQIGIDSLL